MIVVWQREGAKPTVELCAVWKFDMQKCVDASPLVVCDRSAAATRRFCGTMEGVESNLPSNFSLL